MKNSISCECWVSLGYHIKLITILVPEKKKKKNVHFTKIEQFALVIASGL